MTFHANDGLTFQKLADGQVVIKICVPPHFRPSGGFDVLQNMIDPDTWCSIVAAMSAGGETGETWRKARAIHMGGEADV